MLAGAEVDAPTVVRVQQAQREGGTTQEHRRQEGEGVSTERKCRERGEPASAVAESEDERQGDEDFPLPPSHPRSVKEVCLTDGAPTV